MHLHEHYTGQNDLLLSGAILAMALVLSITCIDKSMVISVTPLYFNTWPMFRLTCWTALHAIGFGFNMVCWEERQVNYRFIFTFDSMADGW